MGGDADLRLAVSHTTRRPRVGERDGEHYHFVSRDAFVEMIDRGQFLEHARVFGHLYGTSEQAVRAPLQAGDDLVLEIDWQGARQVRRRFPEACSIFILPPSIEVLRHRLEARGQDDPEVVERRMGEAVDEISHYREYDYLLVNDDFSLALRHLRCLITAQRLRQVTQARRLDRAIRRLLAGH